MCNLSPAWVDVMVYLYIGAGFAGIARTSLWVLDVMSQAMLGSLSRTTPTQRAIEQVLRWYIVLVYLGFSIGFPAFQEWDWDGLCLVNFCLGCFWFLQTLLMALKANTPGQALTANSRRLC